MRLRESDTAAGACPGESELEAFVLGDLPGERLEFIAEHVEECARCAARLEGLDRHQDGLVADLGRLGSREESRDEVADGVPPGLVAAAQSIHAQSPELVVDPGRKIAHSLSSGPVQLGRFELLEELGVGSFGYVFRAHDTELDRTVAIKVQRSLPEHDEERQRFLREARSAAQLEHPHIVSLYETGETEEGVAYLVTEFIDGVTLEERLAEGPLAAEEAARVVTDVALALDSAHRHGVIHRDVKPSNVMLDREGKPHVMDFGLAKRDVEEATVTPDGALMGTPAYMSPEIARGEAHGVDARSDVYSLGVVLYEALTGERPFRGNRRMLILQVLEDDPRPPRQLDDRIPRDLETICLKALEKSPARRYATARELALDLQRFLGAEPILARSVGGLERLWRWCRRNQLAAGLFVAILLGSTFGFWHLSRLSGELIRRSATESAAQYSAMLEVVNAVYSTEVVDRVGNHGIEVTADYAARDDAIPLPATLLSVLLERISAGESGMRGRHFSEYPFKTRTAAMGGGPQNAIEWEALRHLRENPEVPYERLVDGADGRPALLYATARRMKASCVECHNSHPDSTKRDWSVGDVRGVLQIIRPLDRDIERTRAGLRTSFILVGVVSSLLLTLSISTVVLGDRRRKARNAPEAAP